MIKTVWKKFEMKGKILLKSVFFTGTIPKR